MVVEEIGDFLAHPDTEFSGDHIDMQIINSMDVEAQLCVAGIVSEKVGQLLHEHIIDSVKRYIKC
jgi:hypothetical protein